MQQQQYQTFFKRPEWTSMSFPLFEIKPPIVFHEPNSDDELKEVCDNLRKNIVLLKTMEKLSERIEDLKLKKIKLEEKSNDQSNGDELSMHLARESYFEGREWYLGGSACYFEGNEKSSFEKEREKEIINNELRDAVKEKKNLDEQLMKLNTGYISLQRKIEVLQNGQKGMREEYEALCRHKFAVDSELLERKQSLILGQKQVLERDVAFGAFGKQTEVQRQLNKLIAKDNELPFVKWTKTNFKSEKKEEQESLKHKIELFECKKVMLEGKLKLLRDLQQTPTHMIGEKFKEHIALYIRESITLNKDLDSLQQRNQQIEKEIREAIQEINKITWESANLSSRKNALETSNDPHESCKSRIKEKINLIDNQLQLLERKDTYLQQPFKAYEEEFWENFDD